MQVSNDSVVCVVPAGLSQSAAAIAAVKAAAPVSGDGSGLTDAASTPVDISLAATQLADSADGSRSSLVEAAQVYAPVSAPQGSKSGVATATMAAGAAAGGRVPLLEARDSGAERAVLVGRVAGLQVAPERGGRQSMRLTLQVRHARATCLAAVRSELDYASLQQYLGWGQRKAGGLA